MAAAVTRRIRRAAALALVVSAGGICAAEPLSDPTRNPLLGRAEEGAVVAQPAPAPTRLQMILRGPGELRTAVIDGSKVAVGDTVAVRGGTARIERITDTSVVLAHGDAKETLQLLPGTDHAVRCTRRPDGQRPGGC